MFLPSQRGKGTLILQDFKKRVQKGNCFEVAIIPLWTPPRSQPLPGDCQGFLKNGPPPSTRSRAASSRSRLAFSFLATVHTHEPDQILLGRASQHRFVLFQLWTPRLFPSPTELLKLFIPGHRQKSTPREDTSRPKGVWYDRVSTSRPRAPRLELQVLRKVNFPPSVCVVGLVFSRQRYPSIYVFIWPSALGLRNLC